MSLVHLVHSFSNLIISSNPRTALLVVFVQQPGVLLADCSELTTSARHSGGW